MPFAHKIDWATPNAAALAALASATVDDLIIGTRYQQALVVLTPLYDAYYSASVETGKAAGLAAYTAAHSAWTATKNTATTQYNHAVSHGNADITAQHFDLRQAIIDSEPQPQFSGAYVSQPATGLLTPDGAWFTRTAAVVISSKAQTRNGITFPASTNIVTPASVTISVLALEAVLQAAIDNVNAWLAEMV